MQLQHKLTNICTEQTQKINYAMTFNKKKHLSQYSDFAALPQLASLNTYVLAYLSFIISRQIPKNNHPPLSHILVSINILFIHLSSHTVSVMFFALHSSSSFLVLLPLFHSPVLHLPSTSSLVLLPLLHSFRLSLLFPRCLRLVLLPQASDGALGCPGGRSRARCCRSGLSFLHLEEWEEARGDRLQEAVPDEQHSGDDEAGQAHHGCLNEE